MVSRNRALNQIVALRLMAEDQSTTEGERQSARDTIAKLQAKYGIEKPRNAGTEWLKTMAEDIAARARAARPTQAETQAGSETLLYGRPLTDEERAYAKRDPLGFAQAMDGRTHAQKQQDMQNSWGQASRPRARAPKPPWRCAEPLSFFDPGGEPRERNGHRIRCQKCKCTLEAGDGCVTVIGAYCCEKVPGPRKKNSRSTRY